jgi:aminoglycoside phosphotransferase (APT) family kinase protein
VGRRASYLPDLPDLPDLPGEAPVTGWPRHHPVFQDPALSPFATAAEQAVPAGRVVKVLRHVPGHRVTSLVESSGHRLLVKIHSRPVAADTDQHLRTLARAGVAGLAPYPRAVTADGHVATLSYHPGTLLHDLVDRQLLGACVRVGATLRRLHDCTATIGRRWTAVDELARTERCAVPSAGPGLAVLRDRATQADADYVVSHRHFRPGHLVVDRGGSVRLLDFGSVAFAPRGLDLGNLLAHLHRDGLRGVRRPAVAAAAADAFLLGYGPAPELDRDTLDWWTSLSLLRLAGLAEHRRADVLERDLLIGAATGAGPRLQRLATPA